MLFTATIFDLSILNMKYPGVISNKNLYKRCNAEPLSEKVTRSRWRMLGHDLWGPVARVKLSLRMGKTGKRAPVLDWSKLKFDIARALQERYTAVEVKNRFSILEKEDQTATERFERSCIESTDRDKWLEREKRGVPYID